MVLATQISTLSPQPTQPTRDPNDIVTLKNGGKAYYYAAVVIYMTLMDLLSKEGKAINDHVEDLMTLIFTIRIAQNPVVMLPPRLKPRMKEFGFLREENGCTVMPQHVRDIVISATQQDMPNIKLQDPVME